MRFKIHIIFFILLISHYKIYLEDLIIELRAKGSNVVWHDDLVKNWKGEKSSKLDESYDLAIVATPHDYINLDLVGKVPILNTRRSS